MKISELVHGFDWDPVPPPLHRNAQGRVLVFHTKERIGIPEHGDYEILHRSLAQNDAARMRNILFPEKWKGGPTVPIDMQRISQAVQRMPHHGARLRNWTVMPDADAQMRYAGDEHVYTNHDSINTGLNEVLYQSVRDGIPRAHLNTATGRYDDFDPCRYARELNAELACIPGVPAKLLRIAFDNRSQSETMEMFQHLLGQTVTNYPVFMPASHRNAYACSTLRDLEEAIEAGESDAPRVAVMYEIESRRAAKPLPEGILAPHGVDEDEWLFMNGTLFSVQAVSVARLAEGQGDDDLARIAVRLRELPATTDPRACRNLFSGEVAAHPFVPAG